LGLHEPMALERNKLVLGPGKFNQASLKIAPKVPPGKAPYVDQCQWTVGLSWTNTLAYLSASLQTKKRNKSFETKRQLNLVIVPEPFK
jgi:hypothetical protein